MNFTEAINGLEPNKAMAVQSHSHMLGSSAQSRWRSLFASHSLPKRHEAHSNNETEIQKSGAQLATLDSDNGMKFLILN